MAGLSTTVPHIAEQRMDPRARAEGRAALVKLDVKHLTEMVRKQKAMSETYYADMRKLWAYWWDLWQNKVYFGDKEDWQTQIWIPKPFTSVEQAGALIQRSLLDTQDPFSVEGNDDRSVPLATHVWKPLVRLAFKNTNFIGKFADGCKVGFITGVAGYWKYRWQVGKIPTLIGAQVDPATQQILPSFAYKDKHFLAVDYVSPLNIFRDPYSKPRENFSGSFLIHAEWYSRAMMRGMTQNGWDPVAVEKVVQSGGSTTTSDTSSTMSRQAEAERKGQLYQPHDVRQDYLIDEWWGDVVDENGEPIFPDGLMTVSSEDVVMTPRDNPLWAVDAVTLRRKWPFIAGAPIVHPTRFEGRGLVEQNADLSRLFSGTFCMFADGLNWKVNPSKEVFQDALADWNDLADYPGKMWKKKMKERALLTAETGDMPTQEVLAALQFIAQLQQNADFVTDFAIGLPGTRSDITKGEVQIKTAQSLAIFEGMGKNLEEAGRANVELMVDFHIQYLSDFSDPDVVAILGPQNAQYLMGLTLPERVQELTGNYKFSFTGVSQAMQKENRVSKIVQFGQLIASMPYAQIIAQQAPAVFLQLLQTLRDALGLEDKILLPTAEDLPPGTPMAVPGTPGAAGPGGGAPGAPGGAPGGGTPNSPAELLQAYAANARAAGAGNGPAAAAPPSQPAAMGA